MEKLRCQAELPFDPAATGIGFSHRQNIPQLRRPRNPRGGHIYGCLVSKHNRDSKPERYVALFHWMLQSSAWAALSPNGKAVLIEIWRRHNGINNGQIVYAVREGEKIKLSRSVTARALAELQELGFLRINSDSSFSLRTKEARTWRLTAERVDGVPNSATKEFMSWRPATKDIASRERDRPSREREPRSLPRDQNTALVPREGPIATRAADLRSLERDTSTLPDGSVTARREQSGMRGRPPIRFGDEAKEARTARPPGRPERAKTQVETWIAEEVAAATNFENSGSEPEPAAPSEETKAGPSPTIGDRSASYTRRQGFLASEGEAEPCCRIVKDRPKRAHP